MKNTLLLFVVAALMLPLAPRTIALGQETLPKPLDPGWFLDGEIEKFQDRAGQAYGAGKYNEAIVAYLEVLRRNGDDAGTAYNLAGCYGQTGQDTLAALFLVRSWNRGYQNLTHIKANTDFDRVRSRPIFKSTVDSLERTLFALDSLGGARVYVQAPALSYYRVKLPKGYDDKKKYTMVLALHGYSGNLDDYFKAVLEMMPESDVILSALQAPYSIPNARDSYRWSITELGPVQQEQTVQMSEDYIAGAVRILKAKYKPSKFCLMGYSQGGWMTYNAGLRNPKLVDGLIAFGGWIDTVRIDSARIRNAKKLNVLIVHGRNDKEVPFSAAESSRDRLLASGVDVTFFDFDGGHDMTEEGIKLAFAWIDGLKAKK